MHNSDDAGPSRHHFLSVVEQKLPLEPIISVYDKAIQYADH